MTTIGISLFIEVTASLRKANKEGVDLVIDLLTLFFFGPSVFLSAAFLIFCQFGLLDVMFDINIYHLGLRFLQDRDLKKSHDRFTINGVRITPGKLMWSASAFILAIISAGGGWTRNSTLVNISGASNAIVTLLRGILDANYSTQSSTAPRETQIIDGGAEIMEGMENGNDAQNCSPNQNPYSHLEHALSQDPTYSHLEHALSQVKRKGTWAQWGLTVPAVVLGSISAGGGWKNNPTLVNIAGLGAVLIPVGTLLFGPDQQHDEPVG
ncbi:hypothetical protein D9757_013586 [Collybiopsis confluens]|uniref:Uncharacterized protein n=1 Tax=Collybiopsis confluens TaxID=2823264 RepID=A0A8H5GK34_9AGAR|nr:hypothetical protein D9757_014085 [Collybiopsis confluens]KAF5366463.1 hypothetical protein D9757_013586 [Collybiopsis confluens]